jgi:hypothetical protein
MIESNYPPESRGQSACEGQIGRVATTDQCFYAHSEYRGLFACPVGRIGVSFSPMMEADPTKTSNQDNVTRFIHLNGLRLKVAAKV